MRQKILVTGAGGQLGREIKELTGNFPGFEFIFLSRDQLAIDNEEQVKDFFQAKNPSYCINCAAYTAVDKAETETEKAYLINAEAVGSLAAICQEYNCRLLHFSTDYVFDGRSQRPYKEEDPTHAINIYGASKLKGEQLATAINKEVMIIRTSWVYSQFGSNFVKTMLGLMSQKKELNVVDDQFGSPTYAADLANCIISIIKSGNWQPGIYHYCNKGVISWYDFAVTIAELSGLEINIHPISTNQFPRPAARPVYSVLDTEKIQESFGIEILEWKTSLKECLRKMQND